MCDVGLPSGAVITEVVAYGMDSDAAGYFEAAIWRTGNTTFGPTFLSSSFGGTWQSSGVAFTGGTTSFPIFQTTDTPHTVVSDSRYTIGTALKGSGVGSFGFRIADNIPERRVTAAGERGRRASRPPRSPASRSP